MTLYVWASWSAILCQIKFVCGKPWIRSSGGPEPDWEPEMETSWVMGIEKGVKSAPSFILGFVMLLEIIPENQSYVGSCKISQ